jgi:hypothetical protein
LDAHQNHLARRLAEQAQIVEQSGYSKLVGVPRIDLRRVGSAKVHPDGSTGRQAGIHGVDDQQLLTAANLGQQIRSNGAAIDEASHGSDARVSPQASDRMDTGTVVGQQEVSDADDSDGPGRIGIVASAGFAG